MSQHPDEEREPQDGSSAQDREFDSGLDYGAFTSEEPDFPEDRLDQEPPPDPGSGQDEADQHSGSGPPAAPASEDSQPTTAVPPVDDDSGATRSLSEELAAAKSTSSDDQIEAAQHASAEAPSAASEQPTTAVPPAETSSTAAIGEQYPSAGPPRHESSAGTAAAAGAAGAAGAGAAAPAASRYGGSNDEITEADIEEEVTKSKRGASRFLTVLIAIFTPVLFLVAAIRLVGTPVFLWVTYQRPGFPSDPQGFGLEERMLYGSYGMDFLFNLANDRYLADLTGPDGEPLFSSSGDELNEVSHMVDVKEVVWIAMLVGMALLLLTVLFALMLRSWRPGSFARGVFAGAWAMIGILIALVVLAIIDWQLFFAEFHNLFFDGNWSFPEDYTLIRLYPNQFWIDAGIWLGALVLLFSIVALLITWPTKRRRARRADRLAEVHDRRRQKLIKELNTASSGR